MAAEQQPERKARKPRRNDVGDHREGGEVENAEEGCEEKQDGGRDERQHDEGQGAAEEHPRQQSRAMDMVRRKQDDAGP